MCNSKKIIIFCAAICLIATTLSGCIVLSEEQVRKGIDTVNNAVSEMENGLVPALEELTNTVKGSLSSKIAEANGTDYGAMFSEITGVSKQEYAASATKKFKEKVQDSYSCEYASFHSKDVALLRFDSNGQYISKTENAAVEKDDADLIMTIAKYKVDSTGEYYTQKVLSYDTDSGKYVDFGEANALGNEFYVRIGTDWLQCNKLKRKYVSTVCPENAQAVQFLLNVVGSSSNYSGISVKQVNTDAGTTVDVFKYADSTYLFIYDKDGTLSKVLDTGAGCVYTFDGFETEAEQTVAQLLNGYDKLR